MQTVYTITKDDVQRLSLARQLQATRAKTCDTSAPFEDNADFAAVEFRNGSVDVRPVRIGILAKWVSFLPKSVDRVGIRFDAGAINIMAGGSQVRLCDVSPSECGHGAGSLPSELALLFGKPLVLDAGTGSQFVCRENADVTELRTIKATLASERKAEKRANSIRKLTDRKEQLEALYRRNTEHEAAARATLANVTMREAIAQALTLRRAKRHARQITRELTAFLAGSANCPRWPWLCGQTLADNLGAMDTHSKSKNASRRENIRRAIVRRLIDAVPAHFAALYGDNAGVYTSKPAEKKGNRASRSYRRQDHEPRVSVYNVGTSSEFRNARQTLRTVPRELERITADLGNLETELDRLNWKPAVNEIAA